MTSAVHHDILFIINRCKDDDKFYDYVIKSVKRLLNGYAVSYKKKRSMALNVENEWKHIQAHKRGSYVELIKGVIHNVPEKIQNKIKFLILIANMNIRNMFAKRDRVTIRDTDNVKGFISALNRFGDGEALCEEFLQNFDTDQDLKDENDFMYGTDD